MNIETVDVLAELERLGIEVQFVGEDQVKCRCPAHSDRTPSCTIGIKTRLWKCHVPSCGATGDIIHFIALTLKQTRNLIIVDLQRRYGADGDSRVIDADSVERMHAAVWAAKPLLAELYARGLTDDDIRKYRIGYKEHRLQIPILDEYGQYVNVRGYLPGAPASKKMRNRAGMGKIRLFPIAQLAYDSVVICGGECKAIVTARLLNPLGIGAVSTTGGEGAWNGQFTPKFAGKRVWIMMDIDAAGKAAARTLASALKGTAQRVDIVTLPLPIERFPKGDINDWVGTCHATADDLIKLLNETIEFGQERIIEEAIDVEDIESTVGRATEALHVGRRLRVLGVVTAVADSPYIVPARVRVRCDQKQTNCHLCPMMNSASVDEGEERDIPPDHPATIEMVNSGREAQRGAIRSALRIPPCKVVTFTVLTHRNVEEARVSSQLDLAAHISDDRVLTVMSISHGLEGNAAYAFRGKVFPHPKTQAAVMLVTEQTPAQDALSAFNPSVDEREAMRVFQAPATPEAVQEQLGRVYDDLSANVTRIFKRPDLHLIVDLAYHSPLMLRFDGRVVKGWVEVLIAGDTAQGKSETTTQLMRHYGLGERVDVKNASVAGLVGGLQQLGSRWFVTWGKIPMHDRRLVILEELKGLPVEAISKLTDMRSSGIADIDKIQKRRTYARTRLIALSNPRSSMPVGSYTYGVDVIRELIGNPEDIRRFDAAMVVSSREVAANEMNLLAKQRPEYAHTYTAELCRRLVLWAWTRRDDQILFDLDAERLILDRAGAMCDKYVDTIPLVDRGSMRLKLARLSAALAARLFSTNDGETLHVQTCHVEYIAAWLDRLYASPAMGYADMSAAVHQVSALKDAAGIKSRLLTTPFPGDLVERMLILDEVELRDVSDLTAYDREDSIAFLSYLVRMRALERQRVGYRKTPQFIELLKGLLPEAKAARPPHATEKF